MSATVTNDLIYEVLKTIQSQGASLRDDMDNVKSRLTSIDTRLGLVHTDLAHQSERLDRLELRMGRVEKRPGPCGGLTDPQIFRIYAPRRTRPAPAAPALSPRCARRSACAA
jgi:hypothetical protein